ncbi:MAG: coproporphyrinogen III oxidase, partial [Deltaproteobacteria bacterium]|nr:coproporphyrinogen III oxidase [Deltaproteobacteria bacterium]
MSGGFGIYVHVPYCAARCPYCDFNVTVEKTPPWARFAEAVTHEIRARAEVFPDASARSLYFGGGTPSLAPAEALL